MIPYGKIKRGSSKLHPHNECGICSEQSINKKRARQRLAKQIKEELECVDESKLLRWIEAEAN
jgi:hypothetical protein